MGILKTLALLLSISLAVLLSSCNSDSGGTSLSANDSAAAGVGSVAVLLTDGPIHNFDQFWLTVTEISVEGDDGTIVLFSGSERIDLLDLDSYSDLFSVAEDVPAGTYTQITLQISDPLLVKLDSEGNEIASIVPEMSANGKLKLNPRSQIIVTSGDTLTLQLDLDANKSIHLHRQGHGRYRFRPVVFVKVLSDAVDGKLVRFSGLVGNTDDTGFELCRQNTLRKRCIYIYTDADTAFFDADGLPLETVTLAEDDPATVLGYWHRGDRRFSLDGQVVELAAADVYQQITGVIETLDLDNNSFTLRQTDDTLLTVEFDDTSKFFAMTGEALADADLEIGTTIKVDGVLSSDDDLFRAAAIFITIEVPDTSQLSGEISLLFDDLSGFNMIDDELGDACVQVSDDTNYYLLTVTDDSFSSEVIGYADLQQNQHVEVYGEFNQLGCFEAENILTEAVDTEEGESSPEE